MTHDKLIITVDHSGKLMRQQHYGAVARAPVEEEPSFTPGPVDVKTFPERWRKAPAWIGLALVSVLDV